jgi:membrane-bound lytic murein transglycosylase D
MDRARRAIAIAAVTIAAAFASVAARADDTLFPRPAELEPAVRFWTRVYTEIDTRSGFIHDSLHLGIVYQTVKISDGMSPRERRRRVERSLQTYKNIVTRLASGARENLNAEEQRVLALFPEGTTNSELRAAAQRLRFQLGQADRFRAGLIRSGTWKPYIYEVLEAQGLPRELAALPHVESSFDPTAYSKVGAAGMWQFTRSTGVRYMRIDHIIDERRDPFFSTDSAARLLSDNYSVLQSWPLALTAYNHGLAGMRRAAEQQKTTDIAKIVWSYQSRSFGFASRNFYAAFLAALDIDTNPEKYFGDLRIDPPSDTAVVEVPDYLTADTLADALNLRQGTLRELNPALMDSVWAGDKYVPRGFELRVPRSTAAVAEDLLAAIDSSERYAAQRPDLQHRVRRGDTLSQIAAEYRVSLAALMRVNGLSARDVIRVGQMISLPVAAQGAPVAAVAAVETPSAASGAAVASVAAEPGADGTYVVRRGDSIERIANRLGVDAQALLAANVIADKNRIYAGQTLRVPGREDAALPAEAVLASVAPVTQPEPVATVAAAAAVPEPVAVPAALPTADPQLSLASAELEAAMTVAVLENGEPAPADVETALEAAAEVNALSIVQADLAADPSDYSVSNGDQIVVQALETLGHYADWLEIPTQRLRDVNGMSFREAVVIGQKLTLDFSRVDAPTFEQRRVTYQQQRQGEFFAAYQIEDIEEHTIKSGESLWVLAARTYRVPVWLLRQYNPDLNLDRVMPGTVVKFPRLRAINGDAAPVETVADNDD